MQDVVCRVPMVRVHLLPNIMHAHADGIEHRWHRAGCTVAQLYSEYRLPQWGEAKIAASLNGRKLTREEWTLPLADGADVVLAPDPEGIDPVSIIVLLVISVAVNFAYAALVGMPEVPGVAQQRGFDRSPTYAWDQISSEYRSGFPVPLLYGLHDSGGQVIYTNVQASPGGINIGPNELLRIVLVVSDGRIEAIGDVDGDTLGEVDALGGFNGQITTPGPAIPADIRVNGNRLDHTLTGVLNTATGFWEQLPNAKVWLRLGEIAQSPLPSNPFTGVSSTDVVGADLRASQSQWVHTINDTREMSLIDVVIEFPSGLYQQDNQGNITRYPATGSLDFLVEYRPVGVGAWRNLGIASVTQAPILSRFAVNRGFQLLFNGQPVAGPIEIRVTRLTDAGGTQVVSAARWRQTNYSIDQTFAYPRCALIGLEVAATETTVGTRPNFVVRCKGRKVRVYDATIGSGQPSDDRYWELPAAGDPYNGIWNYEPGRNPAWILADFLTAKGGLGEWLGDSQVDWDTIRDWADFCDQDVSVGGVNEAYMTFDGVIDEPLQAWDYILRICQAGRAVPVVRNGKVSVSYQYSGSHGRGTNSVPAKVATQLVATSNVQDFGVKYRNTEARPGVIVLQILNETKDYAQDPIEVQDPQGGFDDVEETNPLAFVKQVVQLWGVTRASQARREGLFMHAVNRTTRSQITFKIGPESLAATIGDVLAVQHDIFRPYDVEAFGMRIETGGAAVASVTLSRDVTLAPATTYELVYRDLNADPGTSDAVKTVVVTALAGSYPRGTAIAVTGTIDVANGAPCALGVQAKVRKDYQIIAVTLEDDETRKVTAVDWVPDVHDIVSEDNPPESGGETAEIVDAGDDAVPLIDDNSARLVSNIALRKLPGTRGRYTLTWEQPRGDYSRPARIYMRPTGATTWWSMGETKTQQFDLGLTAAEQYDFAISLADRARGVFQLPDVAGQATITADEFQPVSVPSVHGVREQPSMLDGVQLFWPAVDSPQIEFYEARWGDRWNHGALAFRTREPEYALRYPMTDPGTNAILPLLLRARHREGLYSTEAVAVDSIAAAHDVVMSVGTDAVSTTKTRVTEKVAGAFFGHTYELNAGELQGEIEWGDEELMTLGYDAEAILLLSFQHWAEDQITVDEATFTVDSGEALWRTVDGREGTPAIPGVNFHEIVDDFTATIDDTPDDRLVSVYRGEPGQHAGIKVWVKYALNAESLATKDWEQYEPRPRAFAKWAVKVELLRDDADTVQAFFEGLYQEVVVSK